MRRILHLLATVLTMSATATVLAQKHTGGSSPPTAPPQKAAVSTQPVVPVSSGMGAMQFFAVNYGVPAPQSLARQLEAEDDRTRSASLAAIGAPAQYLQRGHIPFAHSIQLDFVALGNTDELDAVLTVELDQHLVSAILMPDNGNWKRVGSMVFPTPFFDPTTSPGTFVRTTRSFTQPNRYRVIYHSYVPGQNTDYAENEAQVRILNNKAVVTISFVSNARTCVTTPAAAGKPAKPGCELVQRWLQGDPLDPARRFILVTGTGRLNEKEMSDVLSKARPFQTTRLRTFTCQPYIFSDVTERYEPMANASPCLVPPPTAPAK
jgi:hypothetical protein